MKSDISIKYVIVEFCWGKFNRAEIISHKHYLRFYFLLMRKTISKPVLYVFFIQFYIHLIRWYSKDMRFFVFIIITLANESFMKSNALFPKMDKLKSFLFGDVSILQFIYIPTMQTQNEIYSFTYFSFHQCNSV